MLGWLTPVKIVKKANEQQRCAESEQCRPSLLIAEQERGDA
jgi:hypothetical protein